jgi:hypothetical protein
MNKEEFLKRTMKFGLRAILSGFRYPQSEIP